MRLSARQSAIEVSSVHAPGASWKGPPPIMSSIGAKEPGGLNSRVVPSASPTARPNIAPRYRSAVFMSIAAPPEQLARTIRQSSYLTFDRVFLVDSRRQSCSVVGSVPRTRGHGPDDELPPDPYGGVPRARGLCFLRASRALAQHRRVPLTSPCPPIVKRIMTAERLAFPRSKANKGEPLWQ